MAITTVMMHLHGDSRVTCERKVHQWRPEGYVELHVECPQLSCTIFPTIKDLRRLHDAIGRYLFQYDPAIADEAEVRANDLAHLAGHPLAQTARQCCPEEVP